MSKPHEVNECLKRLGTYIEIARKRRRLTAKQMAGKLDISVPTYLSIEHGSPTVKLSNYLTALWIMGLLEQALKIAHPDSDSYGKELELRRLLRGRCLESTYEANGRHDF